MKVCIALIFSFLSVTLVAANEFTAKVINVIDGNTLEVITANNEKQKLILAGIDCPEMGQTYADKAKKVLEKLILEKEVVVTITGKDRSGNYLAAIKVVRNDMDPRIELLEEGLAWTSEKNPIADFESIRLKAMERQKGIWKESDPKAPWIYRREQSMMQAKSS
jgi:micrococcal nuclease